MNFKTIMFTILFLILAITSFIFLKKSHIRQKNSDTFIVGTTAAYAPFVSINPQGEYEGFDIDIANVLAKEMNKKLTIKDLGSMTSLLTSLEQGSIDAIIWGMSITQDRLKKVAMIHYQGETITSYPLIFWQQIPSEIKSISDMQGKIVCVEPASSQDAVLSKYAEINKLPVEKIDDALLNIQYRKADAALVEPAIAQKFKNKYPEIQILNVPLAQEDQVQGIGIVLKKNNTKLTNQVKEAVKNLKNSGIITQLEKKWDIS